jgi:hypothetical protein
MTTLHLLPAPQTIPTRLPPRGDVRVSGRAHTPSWVYQRRLTGRLWNTASCFTAAPLTHWTSLYGDSKALGDRCVQDAPSQTDCGETRTRVAGPPPAPPEYHQGMMIIPAEATCRACVGVPTLSREHLYTLCRCCMRVRGASRRRGCGGVRPRLQACRNAEFGGPFAEHSARSLDCSKSYSYSWDVATWAPSAACPITRLTGPHAQ